MSEYTPTTPAEESPVWEAADRLRHHGFPWLAELVEEMARERAKRPDRIEVLEKNLAYEVAQKIKLAEQLQAATTTSLTLEQARWKMHAGIDSRCSEEVAAKAKPVIDLVLSSLALEPEAREEHRPVDIEPSDTGSRASRAALACIRRR